MTNSGQAGVIIAVLTLIVVVLGQFGFFDNPEIYLRSDPCPSSVSGHFQLSFVNHGGKNAAFEVTVCSDKINFTKNSQSFILISSTAGSSGSGYSFEFDNPFPGLNYYDEVNFTINYEGFYKRYFIFPVKINHSCSYEKKAGKTLGSYNLIQ